MGWHLRHRWSPVSVKWMLEQAYRSQFWANWDGSAVPFGKAEPVTLVLYRCAGCGGSETRRLDGHWTIAQVKGE